MALRQLQNTRSVSSVVERILGKDETLARFQHGAPVYLGVGELVNPPDFESGDCWFETSRLSMFHI